jgi:hypothetical protein
MIMGAECPGPKTDCNANYNLLFSEERTPYHKIKKFSGQEKKRKNLVMGPKRGSNTKTDWVTDHWP